MQSAKFIFAKYTNGSDSRKCSTVTYVNQLYSIILLFHIPLSLSLFLSVSLSPSLSPSHPLSLSPSLPPSLPPFLPPSLPPSLSPPLSLSLSLSLCLRLGAMFGDWQTDLERISGYIGTAVGGGDQPLERSDT